MSELDDAMTEAQLQDLIISVADQGGWLVFHDHDSRRNRAGFPDLVLVRPPDAMFLELKTVKGRVSQSQKVWVDALTRVDHFTAAVVRPADADVIVRRLLR